LDIEVPGKRSIVGGGVVVGIVFGVGTAVGIEMIVWDCRCAMDAVVGSGKYHVYEIRSFC
jgi:hypothetical protein